MIKLFLLHDWILILILSAFSVLLKTTVFIDKKTASRLYVLINVLFALSVIVFVEFYLGELGLYKTLRTVLMAIRYSATPLIIAMTLFTLAKKERWFVFIPAVAVAIVNIVSIFTGIVFRIKGINEIERGPLGYLPFIAVGLYSAYLVYTLFVQSNKQATEIIPIGFLTFSFVSGLILPFILQRDYSQIFCSTIAVALFVYYDFSILQLSKKDSLTGLLNRQAYDSAISTGSQSTTSIIMIDMNGLKVINDTEGHKAGDEALETVALCFMRATKPKQLIYRIGGDEFAIICRRTSESEVLHLINRIRKNVTATKYSCSVGYSYVPEGTGNIEEMINQADKMMYDNKANFYRNKEKRQFRKKL